MRKIGMKRALIGAAIAAFAMNASAAHAASATGTAKAKILRQITLTNTSDLQYATIISGATASTVAVTTAGARTCGAGLTCTGTPTAANFNVAGTDGAVVLVGGDASVSLTGSLGGTMASTLTYSSANITLGATGGRFTTLGTLSVGARVNLERLYRDVQRHRKLPIRWGRRAAARQQNGGRQAQVWRPLFSFPSFKARGWLAKYQPCWRRQDVTIGMVWAIPDKRLWGSYHATLFQRLRPAFCGVARRGRVAGAGRR